MNNQTRSYVLRHRPLAQPLRPPATFIYGMFTTMKIRSMHRGLLLAACVCLSAPGIAADGHIGMFKSVGGTVSIVRGEQTLVATPGTLLQAADRLESGPNASAGIVFNDGTLLTLGASTQLEMRDYAFEPKASKYAFSAYLAKGTAIYSSGTIGKVAPQSVTVATPQATVGVRGTRFVIEAR